MPFGLVTTLATFCKLMRFFLQDLSDVKNFIGDILIRSITFEDYLVSLTGDLRRLWEASLIAKLSKCIIANSKFQCLGHIVGEERVHLYPDKERTAQDSNLQRSSYDLFWISSICTGNSFQTVLTYHYHFRILLGNFFQNKIQWTAAQEISSQNLKKALTASPILKLLNLSQVFIRQTNASDRVLSAFLLQEDLDEKNPQPISYISRKLNKAEENHLTTKREFIAIVWAIQQFYKYLHVRGLF